MWDGNEFATFAKMLLREFSPKLIYVARMSRDSSCANHHWDIQSEILLIIIVTIFGNASENHMFPFTLFHAILSELWHTHCGSFRGIFLRRQEMM